MTAIRTEGGPWHGKTIDNYSAVPAKIVPVYEQPGTGMQCDDEQVIKLLGRYEFGRWPFPAYYWIGFDDPL